MPLQTTRRDWLTCVFGTALGALQGCGGGGDSAGNEAAPQPAEPTVPSAPVDGPAWWGFGRRRAAQRPGRRRHPGPEPQSPGASRWTWRRSTAATGPC